MAGESARTVAGGARLSEADLCAAFIASIPATPRRNEPAWRAYPETAGFDILLVRQSDGVQVGIEAKLALNPHVVAQALPDRERWYSGATGPDYRAVLVPRDKIQNHMPRLCAALGITVIGFRSRRPEHESWGAPFDPLLPREDLSQIGNEGWFEWAPETRCPVPDYVPDVIAGASAPIALTAWKVKAIRIAVLLEERPVTRADFKHIQIAPTTWMCPRGWLDRTTAGWVRSGRMPDFRAQHPRNYEEIRADKALWAPKLPPLVGSAPSLEAAPVPAPDRARGEG